MRHVTEVATRLLDGRVFSAPAPGRHGDCIRAILDETDLDRVLHCHTQGFLDNEGRFMGRSEAAHVAYAAGQIPEVKGLLFSEDLW